MIKGVTGKIRNGEVPLNYRDPQEYMSGDSRTAESDVYSYGMYIFREISGTDYFERAGIPEDECFMMADPDSENSVIDEKYIPEEYSYLAPLLKKMTVYRRNLRIKTDEVLSVLESFSEPETQPGVLHRDDCSDASESAERHSEETETNYELPDRYSVKTDFDYGIILNNKRSGRIEFRPLLFHDGRTESYTVPVQNPGRFTIAVSERNRDFSNVSNPSSVYGDCIVPVGLAEADGVNSQRLCISVENSGGKLRVTFADVTLSGEKTGKTYDVRWG